MFSPGFWIVASTAALTAPSPRVRTTWKVAWLMENPVQQFPPSSPPSLGPQHGSPTPSCSSLTAQSHPGPFLHLTRSTHVSKPFKRLLQVTAGFLPPFISTILVLTQPLSPLACTVVSLLPVSPPPQFSLYPEVTF